MLSQRLVQLPLTIKPLEAMGGSGGNLSIEHAKYSKETRGMEFWARGSLLEKDKLQAD